MTEPKPKYTEHWKIARSIEGYSYRSFQLHNIPLNFSVKFSTFHHINSFSEGIHMYFGIEREEGKKNVAENHRQSWNSLNSFSSGRKIDSVARNSIYSAACFLDQHGFRNLGKFDAFKQNSMMLHEDIFNRSKFRSWCKTDGRYFMCDKLENHRNRMNGYWWDSPEIDF